MRWAENFTVCPLIRRKRSPLDIHWKGGWVSLTAGVDVAVKTDQSTPLRIETWPFSFNLRVRSSQNEEHSSTRWGMDIRRELVLASTSANNCQKIKYGPPHITSAAVRFPILFQTALTSAVGKVLNKAWFIMNYVWLADEDVNVDAFLMILNILMFQISDNENFHRRNL
jgi:hypothetical protein